MSCMLYLFFKKETITSQSQSVISKMYYSFLEKEKNVTVATVSSVLL